MTYFADGVGNTCALDLPDFPMVYFTSLNDPVIHFLYSQNDSACLNVLKLVIDHSNVAPHLIWRAQQTATLSMRYKSMIHNQF